jgi:hypothetical protein
MVDEQGNIIRTPPLVRLKNVYLPIECPPGVEGHFPDPYDCSAYHYCIGMLNNTFKVLCNDFLGGVDKPTFCDAGLYWDKSELNIQYDCFV